VAEINFHTIEMLPLCDTILPQAHKVLRENQAMAKSDKNVAHTAITQNNPYVGHDERILEKMLCFLHSQANWLHILLLWPWDAITHFNAPRSVAF